MLVECKYEEMKGAVIYIGTLSLISYYTSNPRFRLVHFPVQFSVLTKRISSNSVDFELFPPVFTCVHLCSPVFTCVHLCSPVFTCVHLAVSLFQESTVAMCLRWFNSRNYLVLCVCSAGIVAITCSCVCGV